MGRMRTLTTGLVALLLLTTCGGSVAPQTAAPVSSYTVIHRYPHATDAFTEGLLIDADNATLYESTGLNGESSLRREDLATGQVLARVDIPAQYFAEGLTLFHGKLYQLTWQSHTGFIYDAGCFCQTGKFAYDTEGWGLANDDTALIMSDGTERIRFLDPDSLAVTRVITVTDGGQPVEMLNELEYVRGEIYANVWMTDRIARIDPATGIVRGWIDLTGLLPEAERGPSPDNVLNGIAYDAASDRLFVTGKRWPALFEIRITPPA